MTSEKPMDTRDALQGIQHDYGTGHIPLFDRSHPGCQAFWAAAQAIISATPVIAGGERFHVGGGHADPLDTFDRSAGAGGTALPLLVLPDGDHRPELVRRRGKASEVASAAADQRNRLAYARSVVMGRIRDLYAIDRETGGQEERNKVAKENLFNAIKAYPESLEAEMDAYDAAIESADLEEARAARTESLDRIARDRSESLEWEAQKHRVDLGAACVNLDRARGEVAKLWKDLSEAISRSGTLDEIERAYAYGVRVIGEIQPLNLPLWTVGNENIEDSRPTRRTVYGRRNDIRARQPDGDVPGSVTILDDSDGVRALEAAGATVGITRDGSASEMVVTLPPDATAPITVTIVARNECGENDITVTFDPGQAPA